jgi:general stress protein YciG
MQEQEKDEQGQFADSENSEMNEAQEQDTGEGSSQSQQGSGRGFAGMSEDKRRAIASKGGKAQGKATNPGNFANDREKAAAAGQKGGQNSHGGGRTSQDSDE